MARPKKEKDESRVKLMQVRLKESEFDEFSKAASSSGLDLSGWVRERLLTAARREVAQQKRHR
jgi:hypothetical protein